MSPHTVVTRARRTAAALLVSLLAVLGVLAPPAAAAVRDEPLLRLAAVPTATAGQRTPFTVSWVVDGRPVTGEVNLQRKVGSGAWTQVRTLSVLDGAASTVLSPSGTAQYRLRARSASSPSGVPLAHPAGTSNTTTVTVVGSVSRASAPVLTGPVMVGSDGAARLAVRWTSDGDPVTGQVSLQRDTGSGFRHVRYVTVRDGAAVTALTVPTTAVFRLRVASAQGVTITKAHPYGTSNEHRVSVPAPTPTGFRLTGGGWGHGVGMSQYGAYGMARDGHTRTEILQHFYTDVSIYRAPAAADDRDIQVQVSKPRSSTTVQAVGGRLRIKVGGVVRGAPVRAGATVTVTPSATGGVAVTSPGNPTIYTSSPTSPLQLEWESTRYWSPGAATAYVTVSGSQGTYRHGRLHFTRIDGKVNGTVSVRFSDEYMYGIAEVPSSWPSAALQAQVVAARSYALAGMPAGLRDDCGCHMYDSVRSQNYTGWKKESEAGYGHLWRAAVDATMSSGHGLVMFRKGTQDVVQAFYFSSSGGRTENSEDVWVSRVPYLRSVADPWSRTSINPNASWTDGVTQSAARSAFGLSDVQSIRVVARTTGGSVTLRATSRSGQTATLQGEQVRTGLGLKSAWVRSVTATY